MHITLIPIVLVSAALAWQPQTAERDIAHDKLDFLVGEWTARIEVDFGGDTSPVTFPAEARFGSTPQTSLKQPRFRVNRPLPSEHARRRECHL